MTNIEAIMELEQLYDLVSSKMQIALDVAFESLDHTNNTNMAKWVETGYVGNGNYTFQCSNCKATDTHTKAVNVPYCWKCGSKMIGEKNQ